MDKFSREPESAPLGLRSDSVPGDDGDLDFWDQKLRWARRNPY